MSFEVLTPPQQTALTTLARVRTDFGITAVDAALDAYLTAKIQQASDAIAAELDRPICRQRIVEQFGGTGRTTATLEVTPIAAIEAVTNDMDGPVDLALGDVAIENREAGIVRHRWSWPDDSPRRQGLTLDMVPQAGETPWTATYLGGWLTRADDFSASGVAVVGRRLTLPTGVTAPLLASGDQIVTAGFGVGNNGRLRVVARTDSTIDVGVDLNAETAGAAATIQVANLPGTLERLTMDAVKAWYYGRRRDPSVRSESLGDWSASYGKAVEDQDEALPGSVLKGLDRYRRLM